ncbi:MAG: universal stress protein [Komagataeibacter hansenii]|nr:universal stress protein [Novacetimonas hansenii]
MKTALVILNRPQDVTGLLAAGLSVLRAVGGMTMSVLAAREPPEDTIVPTEEMLTDTDRARIRAQQREWADGLHDRYHDWLAKCRADGTLGEMETNWLDPEISVERMIRACASETDLIVIGFPQSHDSDQKRRAVRAAIFDSARPVLFIPPGWDGPVGRNVLLAWKDTASCRRTFVSVRPILDAARDVEIVGDGAGAAVDKLLPGLQVTPVMADDGGAPVEFAAALLRLCRDNGRDMLVMGGYAHGRLYNHIIGSVTQIMLESPEIPIFLQH